jgi:hypothetical protein
LCIPDTQPEKVTSKAGCQAAAESIHAFHVTKIPYLFHYPHTIFIPVAMCWYDSISQVSGELSQFTLYIKSVLRFDSPVEEDFYTVCAKVIFLV